MFGISMMELVVIMAVALLVLGPDKLPQIASQLGKISFQLKKTSDAFRREFYHSVYKPAEESNLNLKSELKAASQDLLSTATCVAVETGKQPGTEHKEP